MSTNRRAGGLLLAWTAWEARCYPDPLSLLRACRYRPEWFVVLAGETLPLGDVSHPLLEFALSCASTQLHFERKAHRPPDASSWRAFEAVQDWLRAPDAEIGRIRSAQRDAWFAIEARAHPAAIRAARIAFLLAAAAVALDPVPTVAEISDLCADPEAGAPVPLDSQSQELLASLCLSERFARRTGLTLQALGAQLPFDPTAAVCWDSALERGATLELLSPEPCGLCGDFAALSMPGSKRCCLRCFGVVESSREPEPVRPDVAGPALGPNPRRSGSSMRRGRTPREG